MPAITVATTVPETTLCAVREANTALRDLASLGTPYAVAARLRQMGIRGLRHSSMFCPVAQAVHKAVHKACRGDYEVTVGNYSSQVRPSGMFARGYGVGTPPVVAEFIRLFDAGVFPDLVTGDNWETVR